LKLLEPRTIPRPASHELIEVDVRTQSAAIACSEYRNYVT